MEISLMVCNDNRLALNKNPITLEVRNGKLRNSSNVLTPSILLQGDISSIAAQCNYFEIPAFGRYYYVTDFTTDSTGLWTIEGEVDALYSWASDIAKCSGVVGRNEFNYEVLLNDSQYIAKQNPIVTQIDFPGSFREREYILVVAGSQDADLGPNEVDTFVQNSQSSSDPNRPGWVPVPGGAGNKTVEMETHLQSGNYVLTATPSSTSPGERMRVDIGGTNGVFQTVYFDNNNTLQSAFFTVPEGEEVTYYTFYAAGDIESSANYNANYDLVQVFRKD